MVGVAQLVRVVVCGTIGRGFEPHHPPQVKAMSLLSHRFSFS